MEDSRILRLQGRRFSVPEAARTLSPVGDNGTLKLIFDLPQQMDEAELSVCVPSLLLQRADGTAYSRPLSAAQGAQEGRLRLSYLLQRADTAVPGSLQFQLRFTKPLGDNDETVWQSFTDYMLIAPSVDAQEEGENLPATVFDVAKTACLAAVAQAQAVKDSIAPPEIGADGSWVIAGQSTGYPARGEKGEMGEPGPKGEKGDPGEGLSLNGSYDSMAALLAAHPAGAAGEAYLVSGELVLWNGTSWQNVGRIQGPQGAPTEVNGKTGASITLTAADIGAPTAADFTSHTGDSGIHFLMSAVFSSVYPWAAITKQATVYLTPILRSAEHGCRTPGDECWWVWIRMMKALRRLG